MEAQPSQNWNDLIDRHVEIRKNGRVVRTGRVEAVTHAADALWLEGHGSDLRSIFEKAEGYSAIPFCD
ncbi:hypothetical protein [Arthrobacter globiformis]|uniref:hypothetical protein n=1 Tax=Arthrobacter globiformis TaxID=1665 RepID=UPI0027866EEE|nr:hypothetical protein [Arthrobacter globiformis]MDQ0867494.1 hypothetical protein [Arthrobacter globiformis]